MEIKAEQKPIESSNLGSTIEVVRDYTQTLEPNTPVILVNPAHGNEPYILGTAIARGVSNRLAKEGLGRARIVVPLMYGERQKRILLEESGEDAGLVHFDETFGQILKDITFGNGDFHNHLTQIEAHYDQVHDLLRQRFSADSQDLDVRALVDGQVHALSPKNIVASIDTASRVSVEAPLRYFAFPILISELIREAQKEGLGFNDADMGKLVNRMLKVESAYSQVFIPWINPLSYKYADDLSEQPEVVDGRDRIYTPAMKKEYEKTTGKVEEPGIYVMFSGTGSTLDSTHALAQAATQAGLKVYSPPWVEVEGATQVSPDVLNDENILAVFGRAGWGTGWQVQNLALPWIVTPYETGDDPEIYFNNKTIEALRMGKVLSAGDITPEKLVEAINSLSVGTHALNERIRERFGTLNGVDFMADAIARDFLAKR